MRSCRHKRIAKVILENVRLGYVRIGKIRFGLVKVGFSGQVRLTWSDMVSSG